MKTTANEDDGRADSGRENPERQSSCGGVSPDESKRILADIIYKTASIKDSEETLLKESGVISHRMWFDAQDRVFSFCRQSVKGIRAREFRMLLLFRDRIDAFINQVNLENGGEEAVEKTVVLFEDEEVNGLIKLPQY